MLDAFRHRLGNGLMDKMFSVQPALKRLLLEPSTRVDPYPFYAELHERGPVIQEKVGALAVGFDVVQDAFRDPLLGHPDPDAKKPLISKLIAPDFYGGLVHPIQPPSMIVVNAPAHTRYRRLVSRAFTARTVEALRPSVQSIADDLLDAAEANPAFDVMTDYAAQLPVMVIADVLGVPRSDHHLFKTWGYDAAQTLELRMDWPQVKAARSSLRNLNAYFDDAFAQRRLQPRDDLLTALLEAESDGDRLSREELLATALLLLVAGFETTVNLIGNGTSALAQHPEQLRSVQARGEQGWRAAVEEVLRYDAPVQVSARVALEDAQLGGHVVAKGHPVMLLIGASNRDPRTYTDPDAFDTERGEIEHNAFAGGPHFCLGAALSRIEGAVALRALFERFPGLQIGETTRRPSATLRGFRTMQALVPELADRRSAS